MSEKSIKAGQERPSACGRPPMSSCLISTRHTALSVVVLCGRKDGKISHGLMPNITSACPPPISWPGVVLPSKVIGTGKILSASIGPTLRPARPEPRQVFARGAGCPPMTSGYLPILRLTIGDADEVVTVLAHWVRWLGHVDPQAVPVTSAPVSAVVRGRAGRASGRLSEFDGSVLPGHHQGLGWSVRMHRMTYADGTPDATEPPLVHVDTLGVYLDAPAALALSEALRQAVGWPVLHGSELANRQRNTPVKVRPDRGVFPLKHRVRKVWDQGALRGQASDTPATEVAGVSLVLRILPGGSVRANARRPALSPSIH